MDLLLLQVGKVAKDKPVDLSRGQAYRIMLRVEIVIQLICSGSTLARELRKPSHLLGKMRILMLKLLR